jgi:hypothetical protein
MGRHAIAEALSLADRPTRSGPVVRIIHSAQVPTSSVRDRLSLVRVWDLSVGPIYKARVWGKHRLVLAR